MIDFIISTLIILALLRAIYLAQSWILRHLPGKQKTSVKISIIIIIGLAVIGLILGAVITFNIAGFGNEWGPLFAMIGAGVIAFAWFVSAILH